MTFKNGTGNQNGAGLIIVDGDLTINGSGDLLQYEGNTPSVIKNLASVGWLVRGKVVVDSLITNIVGAYLVSGDKNTSNAGEFQILGGGTSKNPQLIIQGAIAAKKIILGRNFTSDDGSGEPAEKIVADGRILLNTPPGFYDVLRTLPTWQFKAPQ